MFSQLYSSCLLLLVSIIFVCNSIELPKKCGISKLHDAPKDRHRIVGGQKAKQGYFPWLAFLNISMVYDGFEVYSDCGASIINSDWLLTAAHCVTDYPDNVTFANNEFNVTGKIEAFFGVIDVNENATSKIKTRRLIKRIVRIGFDSETKLNDLALLELDRELDFNGTESHLMPICLTDEPIEKINTTECYIAGFGYEDQNMETNDFILHYVDESLIPNHDCDLVFMGYNSTQNLCVGGHFKHGTCKGDSGNAMVCYNDGRWVEIGLVSHGIPCALEGIPDVLTNIVHFNHWIREQK